MPQSTGNRLYVYRVLGQAIGEAGLSYLAQAILWQCLFRMHDRPVDYTSGPRLEIPGLGITRPLRSGELVTSLRELGRHVGGAMPRHVRRALDEITNALPWVKMKCYRGNRRAEQPIRGGTLVTIDKAAAENWADSAT